MRVVFFRLLHFLRNNQVMARSVLALSNDNWGLAPDEAIPASPIFIQTTDPMDMYYPQWDMYPEQTMYGYFDETNSDYVEGFDAVPYAEPEMVAAIDAQVCVSLDVCIHYWTDNMIVGPLTAVPNHVTVSVEVAW